MKKRIVSMILALSMVLSILPVSAFADAGAGLSSAATEETNSITYSSENEHEAVGKNSETNNQVVKIKIGTNGLPKAAAGTGWSFDETTGLTITGTGSEDTEYILDGTVSCNVTVKNANSYTVYLLDGTVTGTLLIEADNMYGVYVLGGSYANVQLNLGTIDGGTYDKLTENGGNVRGGFFRDISGLSADTQQQAHQLLLPENCTLNGQKETKIYIIKKYNYSGDGNDLELVVESDTGCNAWAVASTNGSVMALPAGTTDYRFTYGGMTIATVSISTYGKTLSASFSALPLSDNAPMELVQILSVNKELSFTSEGLPDLTAVPVGTELKAIAYEDTETSVFKSWSCTGLELTEEQRTARVVYFTMPDHDVNLKAVFEVPATPDPDPTPDPKPDPNPDPDPTPDPKPDPTPDPDPTPAPGGDSDGGGAAIVAVAAVGGAAIGVGAYIAGTTAYLKSVLPEGMAIPANRQQLAVALWTAAGKPATQSTALFNDVAADAAELQAIRWVVDTGLMSAQDGSFKPGSRVGRMEVIRTWKTYQQRG